MFIIDIQSKVPIFEQLKKQILRIYLYWHFTS